ncbi:MAG: ABC transporter ATP-binding protein [Acidobacteriota bacterium]
MDTATIPGEAGRNVQTSVRVERVTKRYPLFARRRDRICALVGRTRGLRYKTALDGVSLSALPGEAVGIIGENGSGKTTLLRLVAGISRPDEGVLVTTGTVSAILELGMGFHPEFTGRENAMVYGTLVGVAEAVMRDQLDEILGFAELGEFVDQPTRTYSSGMLARLAFAVATNVDPRVLVVDEALAVGDGAFQKKCVDRMRRFKTEGRTVLFCSHSMYLIGMFCDRVVWLDQGRVAGEGTPGDVIPAYETHLGRARQTASMGLEPGLGGQPASIRKVHLTDLAGEPVSTLLLGGDYEVRVAVEAADPTCPFHVGVTIDDAAGRCLAGFTTLLDGRPPLVGAAGWDVRLRIPSVPFLQGPIDVSAYVLEDAGMIAYSGMRVGPFPIQGKAWQPGLVLPEHEWACRPEPAR